MQRDKLLKMRVWFSGRTLASQARNGGSIPLTRFMNKMTLKRKLLLSYLLPTIYYLLFLNGCASTPHTISSKARFDIPGVYHRVEKGQTLWRISRMYNVDLDEIVRINRIPDATNIEQGQLIFIPLAQNKKGLPIETAEEDFIWPLRGKVISSFGQVFNDMITKGINIQKTRSHEITASRSGKVIFYDSNLSNFGKTIIIDHGGGFSTVYARNSEVLIKIGDYVRKGTVIAKLGSTTRDKNAYLHFEIRKGYIPQNPYFYLPR